MGALLMMVFRGLVDPLTGASDADYPVPTAVRRGGSWAAHLIGLIAVVGLWGCPQPTSNARPAEANPSNRPATVLQTTNRTPEPLDPFFFEESWQQYRQRFIQADGRVIDWETDDQRTTSEGQAYAMLRAVMIDDPATFEQVLRWGENNLSRLDRDGQPLDRLWAWKWGPNEDEQWGITDLNFASDADIDVATALILAARRWNRADYLELAQLKLTDIWTYSTLTTGQPHGGRYLLPGPLAAFSPTADTVYLNPSYLAPYAFRLFAQVDRDRDWLSLVDSSYDVLTASAALSAQSLPSNWVVFAVTTGDYRPVPDDAPLKSIYGFDAYRVWWRVGLDAAWFDAPEARQYLQQHLPALVERWQQQRSIPAEIGLRGETLTEFESTAQYAMLYGALLQVQPEAAQALRDQKLLPAYRDGFWDSSSAYYTQNLAWLGLFPPEWVSADWLKPSS
ncbi:MAG: glycosyl hydrolase family 8 [Cyanobacteria bacterium P01_D01_bin.14]